MTTSDAQTRAPGKAQRPTAVQLEALRRTLRNGRLVRHYSGRWTYPSCGPPVGQFHGLAWSILASTVQAMERRGWLCRRSDAAEPWCSEDRVLTVSGRELAHAAPPSVR